MGHYTVRTDKQQDDIILEALDCMGEATVSKGLMTAIGSYKQNQETIRRLKNELAQERLRSRDLSEAIGNFESSMSRMFALK